MTEDTMTQFHQESESAFPVDKENENSSSSSEGEENDSENEDSSSSENNEDGKDITSEKDGGFLNHPRWKEREEDWNKRFNDQETRHQDDLKSIREEFGEARKENKENSDIPVWFGGDQDQWNAYRADRDAEIKEAEARAVEKIKSEKSAQDKAIKEATDYMQSEIKVIESDTEINPDKIKVDQNKLLKFVLDNNLVDSKGNWNYKAGFKFMNLGIKSKKPDNKDRKNIAGATTSDSKAETDSKTYKTSEDFRGSLRPW